MRLLEKKEVWKERQQEEGQLVKRGMKISDLVNKQIETQNRLKDEQAKIFVDFQVKTEAELTKFHNKYTTLEKEVLKLEERKAKALEPLKKQSDSIESQWIDTLEECFSIVDEWEKLDRFSLKLLNYEENLIQRETETSSKEQDAHKRIVQAEEKEQEVRKMAQKVSADTDVLRQKQEENDRIFAQKMAILAQEKAEISAKLVVLDERSKELDEKRAEINKKLSRV